MGIFNDGNAIGNMGSRRFILRFMPAAATDSDLMNLSSAELLYFDIGLHLSTFVQVKSYSKPSPFSFGGQAIKCAFSTVYMAAVEL